MIVKIQSFLRRANKKRDKYLATEGVSYTKLRSRMRLL